MTPYEENVEQLAEMLKDYDEVCAKMALYKGRTLSEAEKKERDRALDDKVHLSRIITDHCDRYCLECPW
jgi:hypothetical protein